MYIHTTHIPCTIQVPTFDISGRASAALNFQVEHFFTFKYVHIYHILFKYLRVRVRASAPFSLSHRGFMYLHVYTHTIYHVNTCKCL